MIINLDMSSDIPIYVQLRNQIVMGIGKGELAEGESLQTVRQLEQEIGVNNMTVNKTYQILKKEGYIEIDRRHGAKVAAFGGLTTEFREKMESELELLSAEATLKGMDEEAFLTMCRDVFKRLDKEGTCYCEG